MSFHPYLMFGGNCRDAFARYHEIFGGELVLITGADMGGPPEMADAIMHAAIRLGDDLLMGSDDPMNPDFGPVQGMLVNYATEDVEDAKRVFEALSDGGEVLQAIEPTSFAALFGMCKDRWGSQWMITANATTELDA